MKTINLIDGLDHEKVAKVGKIPWLNNQSPTAAPTIKPTTDTR
jgi:hypothetical protein